MSCERVSVSTNPCFSDCAAAFAAISALRFPVEMGSVDYVCASHLQIASS